MSSVVSLLKIKGCELIYLTRLCCLHDNKITDRKPVLPSRDNLSPISHIGVCICAFICVSFKAFSFVPSVRVCALGGVRVWRDLSVLEGHTISATTRLFILRCLCVRVSGFSDPENVSKSCVLSSPLSAVRLLNTWLETKTKLFFLLLQFNPRSDKVLVASIDLENVESVSH